MENAAKHDYENNVIRPFPVSSLPHTWLGLVHYFLSHSDLFSSKSSLIREWENELVQLYQEINIRRRDEK
jgi:hypothetical protein